MNSDKKCWPPYLTGTTADASNRACGHLRCVRCDSAVLSFDGWLWSPDVSYLFLRTNYPDVNKLRAKLQPRRTSRAYACQCRSVDTTQPVALTSNDDNTWICTGKN
ncbi:cilia- and flagella-associated protein 418-like [Hyalella azteca]|uniref:Cilia- and flagella-associated protein 418 n=1 Tax=Hyalella azteca TaxID=294128 RepID=A0A979FVT4_HYAAZ|nr:cilia- and flagella-associated protein 418-like [Hyalella azteca]